MNQLHIVLNLFLYELLNSLPPLLPLGIIISLEHTCQDLREQHVAAHKKFDKNKQKFITQIQNWKGQHERAKV